LKERLAPILKPSALDRFPHSSSIED
jgi:hypothetical protein